MYKESQEIHFNKVDCLLLKVKYLNNSQTIKCIKENKMKQHNQTKTKERQNNNNNKNTQHAR